MTAMKAKMRPTQQHREMIKILVVDDEPDNIIFMTALLTDHGYQMIEARNADEALKKIDVILPDLIILDIRLPRQSGISLYRQLKLNDNYRHVPVIFLSAFGIARNFISESFRKLVPDERVPEPELFLEKPVNIDLLLESIEDILARKGGAKTMSRQELQAEISTLMENVDKQKLAEILSVLKK